MGTALNPRHAVYAGSFDPVSLGHFDIICRGSRMFERLTVAIGINPEKRPLFTPQERLQLLQDVARPLRNVEVRCFEGLAVNFVREMGAAVMLRGLRTLTDIEAEFTMTLANRALAPDIETVFLMASEKYSHISSSLIKQVALLGAGSSGEPLESFVPAPVIGLVRARFQQARAAGGMS
jgi:pantetheine-phosphate adenylyltransferase